MAFPKNKRPYQILAVDDLPDNLALAEAILADEGYIVRCVTSGAEALNVMRREPPDLVLLDVMMPDMDGYEVTRRIRQMEGSLPYIPVLLITADHRSNVVKGLDAGADDFIRKPVDIDELVARVRSLLRLKQSIDDQHEMLRQREDFVTRLTHDLRTPLVAANRMLQFCLDGAFGAASDDLKAAMVNLLQNNDNLLQMTNNLLEVYRHESGHKTLTLITFNLWDLAQKVIAELQPLGQEHGLSLEVVSLDQGSDGQGRKDYHVQGDQLELRRVLTNLIGNAIKFTEEGGITVSLSHEPNPTAEGSGAGARVKLTVADTGPGITPEDLPHIFEWFRAGSHRRSNSGLGLHLSRRIVDMHGGSLTVASQHGQGSVFTLLLPATQRARVTSTGEEEEEEGEQVLQAGAAQ
ncbi:hybrid sensor histidine kinase/response regulator [Pseudanabaena sp. FACHB-2040]|uniref:sensor histidine kinase n=1 Tax=Pseudanabaena sp. FACHB-2040 TaxID=2692859 RepID=UPI001689EA88|nr:hybrid sensor histidine kinase/response regulator [Pseudanabaena sp. FACHB-2040]MBD2256015.1 response regulator [Pseudanabaena sp. FACHB-2040]